MLRPHERFRATGIVITFAYAVLTQLVISLLIMRARSFSFFFFTPALLLYFAIFGRAFLLATRRTSPLQSKVLRFAVPVFCSALLVIASYMVGAYLADCLNDILFHMPPVQDRF